jgi:hypothetical protein
VCINAGVEVHRAAGREEENSVHMDIDSVNEDIISGAARHYEV